MTTYLDVAYHILHEAGQPLRYEEITERALAQQLISPQGLTPEATMASRLYTDTLQEGSRFTRAGKGTFGLVDWRPVTLDDGTHGVIDFKTSTPKAEHVAFYGRQLHAYALALEQPAAKGFALAPVTALGLIMFQPTDYSQTEHGAARLGGSVSWLPIPRDDEAFLGFLGQVVRLLDAAELPEAGDGCAWCRYRAASRERGE